MNLQFTSGLIRREFFSLYHCVKFTDGITYLPTTKENLYLNVIIDLYNDEIVTWSIPEHVDIQSYV